MATIPAIELDGITKSYGSVTALDHVGLTVLPGEVHALMGENGAGKSTLMKVLSGTLQPDSGTVKVFGETVDTRSYSPKVAHRLGVAIVHQEFSLIPSLTVTQNIFLGIESTRFGLLARSRMTAKAAELLKRVHSRVSPHALVETLSIAEAQLVEIAKALASDVKIIALDEPSAVLSGAELDSLFTVIRDLAASDVAVLYVSHRIDEVFTLCSRYSVLKDGRNTGTGRIDEIDADTLISLMVGRSVSQLFPESNRHIGEIVLEARQLEIEGLAAPVSLRLHAGEIVGLAGLQGSGRTRLARGLFGDIPSTGGLRVGSRDVALSKPSDGMKHGVAYLPEDRKGLGLALGKPVGINISMLAWRRLRSRLLTIDRDGERSLIRSAIEKLSIKTDPSGKAPVATLSGGNQQKVVIAKWLELLPDVVIFDEPTRGIDVGSKEQIYLILRELADSGKAVLLISSELIEVIGLSDRILVMADGELVGELSEATTGEEDIMRLITSHTPVGKATARP
ncbi:sugar ABC transporter ATP-binding protein [Lysinimonas soli]|uniref:Sugar ABC transporter ATP-binding protein n=1 Tax=Lysinimonas soli TaxID=1074233 RepID=A0ABW0NSY5_9MICO